MVSSFDKNRFDLYQKEILPKWQKENVFAHIIEDTNKSGSWNTCKKAWIYLANQECTHGMVLQDDFVPCQNFLEHLNNFVKKYENSPLGIFQPAAFDPNQTKEFMYKNKDFEVPIGMVTWGGSLILPKKMILEILCIANVMDGFGKQDDTRLQASINISKYKVINIGKSLIRHVGARWESLVGNSDQSKLYLQYREGVNTLA